jgi:hypothetical protein
MGFIVSLHCIVYTLQYLGSVLDHETLDYITLNITLLQKQVGNPTSTTSQLKTRDSKD